MKNISNLSILQNLLKKNKVDFFLINRSDEYLNEYISPNAERLKYITNFSGSAGSAIITQEKAFLYVDGRYTFQANVQINKKEIITKHLNSYWEDLESLLEIDFKSKLLKYSQKEKIKIETKNFFLNI